MLFKNPFSRKEKESVLVNSKAEIASLLKLGKMSVEEVLESLKCTRDGLTSDEAQRRLDEFGVNNAIIEKKDFWFIQLGKCFLSQFNIILIILAITSYFTDIFLSASKPDWTKVIILSIMVSVSSILRFWQESRSEKTAEKLKNLIHNKADILRQIPQDEDEESALVKRRMEINIAMIVPGDIVYLSAGDMIPADMRLISSTDLFVSQSSLTGESMPIEKFAAANSSEKKSESEFIKNPLDLSSLLFMGTNVVSGSGVAVVVNTGRRTYFGSVAHQITNQRDLTSFDIGINKTSWVLIRFMLIMVPIVFIINVITKDSIIQALLFGLAVAVGLTPEMLPLIVTTNLAKGAIKMAKKKVIIKKLNAIQNFGAMDVLCTDKTGTITENRVVLVRHFNISEKESDRVLDFAYLNSHFQTGLKNLMDSAIIEHREKVLGASSDENYHKIDEVPFDFSRRRMSVIVQKENEDHLLICKGAVEEIEPLCSYIENDEGEIVKMTDELMSETKESIKRINQNGLRVLAVAYKIVREKKSIYKSEDENDLVLAGYVGFLDPTKLSAKEAVALLKQHGVSVKIITGDNSIVTAKVAQEINLDCDEILRGDELELLTDEELRYYVERVNIFTKTDPLQKARIINAIRSNGHVVGYLGDGVNDAAALKAADVGISVDNAVDIAKEMADIVLLENDLLVLEQGVIEGRTVFGNIMKYIKMTSSSNFGNVFSILIASAFLPFLPMLPIHLLIQNLLYDFSQLSIPWDKMDKEFLQKPQKWEASRITRFMLFVGPLSSIFDLITYCVMWFVFSANSVENQSMFQSGWFVEGLVSQTIIIHLIRTQKIPFFESVASLPVLALTTLIISIGIVIPFTNFGANIGFTPLPLDYFMWLAGIIFGYFVVLQILKTWYLKRFKEWL